MVTVMYRPALACCRLYVPVRGVLLSGIADEFICALGHQGRRRLILANAEAGMFIALYLRRAPCAHLKGTSTCLGNACCRKPTLIEQATGYERN